MMINDVSKNGVNIVTIFKCVLFSKGHRKLTSTYCPGYVDATCNRDVKRDADMTICDDHEK